jgi:hypothetical protein
MTDFTRATELTQEVAEAIDDAFEYHPWTDDKKQDGATVRRVLAEAVKVIRHPTRWGTDAEGGEIACPHVGKLFKSPYATMEEYRP